MLERGPNEPIDDFLARLKVTTNGDRDFLAQKPAIQECLDIAGGGSPQQTFVPRPAPSRIDEILAEHEARFNALPDREQKRLRFDLEHGRRPIAPEDLARDKKLSAPPSDEEEVFSRISQRDWNELEGIYGDRWPDLRRRVLDFYNRQSVEWQQQQFNEIGQHGQVKVIQRLIRQLA